MFKLGNKCNEKKLNNLYIINCFSKPDCAFKKFFETKSEKCSLTQRNFENV